MLQWAEFRVVVGIVSSKKKKGSLLWQKGERTIRAPLIAVSPRRAALQFRRALHSQHFVFCYSLSVVVLVLFLLGGVQLWLDLKNQQCASDNQKLEIKKFILFTKKKTNNNKKKKKNKTLTKTKKGIDRFTVTMTTMSSFENLSAPLFFFLLLRGWLETWLNSLLG